MIDTGAEIRSYIKEHSEFADIGERMLEEWEKGAAYWYDSIPTDWRDSCMVPPSPKFVSALLKTDGVCPVARRQTYNVVAAKRIQSG